MTTHATRHCKAFSLVETLVAVGIIAILIALLIPAIARTVEHSHQTICANNLRQLGNAFNVYAINNMDCYPFAARLDNNPVGIDFPEDWIHWQKQTPNQGVNHSAIAPYVSVSGSAFAALLRCPSDVIDAHANATSAFGAYPYSYTMNGYFDSGRVGIDGQFTAGRDVNPPQFPANPVRLPAIAHPADKILLVEENLNTINDGGWFPIDFSTGTVATDWLSVRHDMRVFESETVSTPGNLQFKQSRGNVVFVDGHVDFVTRAFAEDPNHIEAQR